MQNKSDNIVTIKHSLISKNPLSFMRGEIRVADNDYDKLNFPSDFLEAFDGWMTLRVDEE